MIVVDRIRPKRHEAPSTKNTLAIHSRESGKQVDNDPTQPAFEAYEAIGETGLSKEIEYSAKE
jgi:hypothetical protein